MLFRILADAVVVLHLGFLAFIPAGGLMAWRWRWLLWPHIAAIVWAVAIFTIRFDCPLTPLENSFRARGGEAGYAGGFVDHYIIPVLYPTGLSRSIQWVLGVLVLGVNVVAYILFMRRRK